MPVAVCLPLAAVGVSADEEDALETDVDAVEATDALDGLGEVETLMAAEDELEAEEAPPPEQATSPIVSASIAATAVAIAENRFTMSPFL